VTPPRTAGALAAISLVLAGGGFVVSASAGDGPTTIGVRNGATERSFSLSRTKVKPGPAIIQYTNTGEDPHDLKVQRKGGSEIWSIGELGPDDVGSISERLKKDSKYILWCSLDGHRESGMEAVLRVKKRR
jgi:plastocyanin